MTFETRKVVMVAALIVATGVGGTEISRASDNATTPEARATDYAGARVDGAFAVSSAVAVNRITIAAAPKGDKLTSVQASSAAPKVMAKRVGESTTVLARTNEYELAQF